MSLPDVSARGLLGTHVDPLRYSAEGNADPYEQTGLMKEMLPSYIRVLDVGCGAGGGTIAMNVGKSNDIVCLEPDPIRCEAAREKGLEVICSYLDEETARQLGCFDAVIMADVIEHVADTAHILAMARSMLRSDGVLLVSVPNVAHWSIRMKLLGGKFEYAEAGIMDATHLRWFTRSSIHRIIENNGFKIVESKGTCGSFLPSYRKIPLLSQERLRSLLGRLTRRWPALFAFQLVVKAQVI